MTEKAEAKGVIFDLDGVIIDTGELHKLSWIDLVEREGWQISDEFFRETFGMQNKKTLPLLAGKELSDEQIAQLGDWKEARFRQLAEGKLELMVGVRELLDELLQNEFRMAIGTSTPAVNLDMIIETLQIGRYFDGLVTAEDVQNSKPAPDTFLAAAEKLNLPPHRCVVIEDAIPGVKAAKAADMAVVAVTTTQARSKLESADLVVDSMAELTAADFEKLLGRTTT